ncbi:hypothetical protein CROQUDRAFT_137143 [Cronartium quercuum f. sp. fusiforme G11]|uniref:Uncharacterized protein n=1 Tax=Cronartium quercuum f. sp. fusiforme G11 TaxID=708437 RepID=A0A9P6N5A8_9BASI|nr:hypothetical protein CROQUDRAFT_137143 [Cronartium quercuum f. sp. fusiforme G11]
MPSSLLNCLAGSATAGDDDDGAGPPVITFTQPVEEDISEGPTTSGSLEAGDGDRAGITAPRSSGEIAWELGHAGTNLGPLEEDLSLAIRERFELGVKVPLADAIIEISTIRIRLSTQYGGYQPEIVQRIRTEALPKAVDELCKSLNEYIEDLKDLKRATQNGRIAVLNNFFKAELADLGMHRVLEYQIEQMGRWNPSIEEIRKQMSQLSMEKRIQFLSEISSTSQGGGLVSRNIFFQWLNYHALAEAEYYGHLANEPNLIESLKVDLDIFWLRTQGEGWHLSELITADKDPLKRLYKLLWIWPMNLSLTLSQRLGHRNDKRP